MFIQNITQKALQLTEEEGDGIKVLHEKNRLILLRASMTTELESTCYEPSTCLILQGAKEVQIGGRSIRFAAGEALIVSHEVPVASRITQTPYLALILGIDLNIIRSLYGELGANASSTINAPRSLEVGQASDELIDALLRLMCATQNHLDTLVLFTQILREVHFRLLQSPCAGMLQHLIRVDSHASRINKAIAIIRQQFVETLSVPELAQSVGMSVSSFHHYFKSVTESTPLQYQKDLRLLEARRLILAEGERVTNAALKVGYESPNQFSREYTRKFGVNPGADGGLY